MPQDLKDPVIKAQTLTRRFSLKEGGEFVALDQIDFSVMPGDIFGIVGMSGAGKSTLLRLLATLDKPSSGALYIDSIDTSTLPDANLRQLRKKLGMVFQDLFLFSSKTSVQNVAFPQEMAGIPKDESLENAKKLIKLVGLKGKEDVYPLKLSGGERQRVAIARALANQPKILLLDEMTSALDPKTRRAILELLFELNQRLSLTIVLITHEMEVVRRICNRVIILDHGVIVEEGAVNQLFAKPQHPITKELIQHIDHEIPLEIPKEGALWFLTFLGEAARKPLLTTLIRQFAIEVNILLGSIDRIVGGEIGKLLVTVSGSHEERMRAKAFLESRGVIIETIEPRKRG